MMKARLVKADEMAERRRAPRRDVAIDATDAHIPGMGEVNTNLGLSLGHVIRVPTLVKPR